MRTRLTAAGFAALLSMLFCVGSATAATRLSVEARAARTTVAQGTEVRVTGKVNGAATITLQRRSGRTWKTLTTARSGKRGTFTLRFTPAAAGKLELRVRARAGGRTAVSKLLRITVQPAPAPALLPPPPPTVHPTAPADTQAPETTLAEGPDALTRATASFAFSASEAGRFECRLDDGAWSACVSPARYDALADGPHEFGVRAIDAAGNADATPATRRWSVDATAPVVRFTRAPAARVAETAATVGFDAGEPGLRYECALDNGAFAPCVGEVALTQLALGDHSVRVRATDAAGNTSVAREAAWRVVLPRLDLCGTIDTDRRLDDALVYVVTCQVTVAPGARLTVSAGTILKVGAALVVAGTLDVDGTASAPVIVTSVADDSAGGDTNGDGPPIGSPRVDTLLSLREGTVDVEHAEFHQAGDAIAGRGGLDVRDSVFARSIERAIVVDGTAPVLRRTTFDTRYTAIALAGGSPDAITLTGPDRNTFTGPPTGRRIELSRAETTAWTFSSESGAILSTFCPNCDTGVYARGRLELAPGSLVKLGAGLRAVDGGTIDASGTAAQPVVITATGDDSRGGDSNGDGPPSAAVRVEALITAEDGATLDIEHAEFHEANVAIQTPQSVAGGDGRGSIDVRDSTFARSIVRGLLIDGEEVPLPALRRNTFDTTSTAISLDGWNGPISPERIVVTGSDGNTFTGARDIQLSHATLANAWTFSSDGGAILTTWCRICADGSGLSVRGSLTIAPGSIVKPNTGLQATTGGTIDVNGTAERPVVFTSPGDYRITTLLVADEGGTLDVDHAGFSRAEIAVKVRGGTVRLQDVTIRDAGTGLGANGGMTTVRGVFTDVAQPIAACKWNTGCGVDATHVDWGTSAGPFPASGPLVCGAVVTDPWLRQDEAYDDPRSPFGSRNCDGSLSPSEQLTESAARADAYQSVLQLDCSGGLADACAAFERYKTCKRSALEVAQILYPATAGDLAVEVGASLLDATVDVLRKELPQFVSSAARVSLHLLKVTQAVTAAHTLTNAWNQCLRS